MPDINGSSVPRRKPVPLRSARSTPTLRDHGDTRIALPSYEDLFRLGPYDTDRGIHHKKAPQPEVEAVEQELDPDLEKQLKNLVLVTEEDLHSRACVQEDPSPFIQQSATWNLRDVKGAVGTALGDAKHFVGGLISRPFEATKHHAILRHSLGLIYYRGPLTSVTITIFSNQPLPSSRQLWLQRRGYSGKAGLAVGAAIGTRTAWIDVTPVSEVCLDEVPVSDERAWQRDMTKFLTKAKAIKSLRNHVPRETLVIPIPLSCEDGYFRVVLCDGRKMLCPSPIFRCASTSCDPSILRGASLRTLPLELGIKAGATIAHRAAAVASQKTLGPAATVARGLTNHSDREIPIHRLGIRSPASGSSEEQNSNGGVYLRR